MPISSNTHTNPILHSCNYTYTPVPLSTTPPQSIHYPVIPSLTYKNTSLSPYSLTLILPPFTNVPSLQKHTPIQPCPSLHTPHLFLYRTLMTVFQMQSLHVHTNTHSHLYTHTHKHTPLSFSIYRNINTQTFTHLFPHPLSFTTYTPISTHTHTYTSLYTEHTHTPH